MRPVWTRCFFSFLFISRFRELEGRKKEKLPLSFLSLNFLSLYPPLYSSNVPHPLRVRSGRQHLQPRGQAVPGRVCYRGYQGKEDVFWCHRCSDRRNHRFCLLPLSSLSPPLTSLSPPPKPNENLFTQLGSTAIGVRTKEGVVLAAEKRVTSPLLIPSSIEKVAEIDEHVGCAMSGLTADARTLIDHGRTQVRDHWWML